jgi:hypothetical protein
MSVLVEHVQISCNFFILFTNFLLEMFLLIFEHAGRFFFFESFQLCLIFNSHSDLDSLLTLFSLLLIGILCYLILNLNSCNCGLFGLRRLGFFSSYLRICLLLTEMNGCHISLFRLRLWWFFDFLNFGWRFLLTKMNIDHTWLFCLNLLLSCNIKINWILSSSFLLKIFTHVIIRNIYFVISWKIWDLFVLKYDLLSINHKLRHF